MAIYKKVNGKIEKFAENNVIDHNQLANRDAYGSHSISAIRKLPERLTALKNKDAEQDALIKENADNITSNTSKISEVETKAKQIDIVENPDEGTFTFYNYGKESSKEIQSGYKPDDDTLTLTDDKKMTLKQIYHSEELTGLGTEKSPLDIKNKADGTTLIIKDNKYVVNALDNPDSQSGDVFANPIHASDIETFAKNTNQNISDLNTDVSGINTKLEAIEKVDKAQNDNIIDLQARTKGIGGYLNAYDFEKATPTQDELTNYALTQISNITKNKIFNQTKVKNLFDGNIWVLTNTPDSDPAVFEWANVGTEYINIANNDGSQGIVTGSYEELEGFIDINGHITINNLDNMVKSKLKLNYTGDGYYSENEDNTVSTNYGVANLDTYTPYAKQDINTSTIVRPENLTPIIDAHNKVAEKTKILKTDQGETKYLNGNGEYSEIQSASEKQLGILRFYKDSEGD